MIAAFRLRLSGILRALARADRGGVAVMFGLAFPVVAFLSLVAVDYSRASMSKQALQEALDAAALLAARSTAGTSEELDAIGDAAFIAQLAASTGINGLTPDLAGRLANVTFVIDGDRVVATATGSITPLVASVYLTGDLSIHANTEVVRSIHRLEIALVLDTTGSMQGTKLANLITAAKNFITTMEGAAARSSEPNPVKISVVPFSTTVRIRDPLSMASYNTSTWTMTGLPTWMDGRARAIAWDNDLFANASSTPSQRADRFARFKSLGIPWGGCVEARVAPYDIRETAPSQMDVDTLFIPFFWPDESDEHNDYLNDYLNDGVSGTWLQRQRANAKYNTTTMKVSGTFIPHSAYGSAWAFGPNAACNMQKIMRLTTDFTSLRNHIDGLVASGETNIPLGLAWGWHTVSPNAPFADGVAYNTPETSKIIVLMTDGDNTMNDTIGSNNANNSYYHGYGYIWQNRLGTTSNATSTRTAKMDERLVSPIGGEALCSNIKAQGILIYTVGVGVSSSAQGLLQQCATSTTNYYNVDSNGASLNAAFDAIAGSIQNLRIAH